MPSATTTTVQSSDRLPVVGQHTTYTASVTSSLSVNEGSVEFRDSGVLIGTVAVSSGTAQLVVTESGNDVTHSIVATYTGTVNFTPSSSSALTVFSRKPFSEYWVCGTGNTVKRFNTSGATVGTYDISPYLAPGSIGSARYMVDTPWYVGILISEGGDSRLVCIDKATGTISVLTTSLGVTALQGKTSIFYKGDDNTIWMSNTYTCQIIDAITGSILHTNPHGSYWGAPTRMMWDGTWVWSIHGGTLLRMDPTTLVYTTATIGVAGNYGLIDQVTELWVDNGYNCSRIDKATTTLISTSSPDFPSRSFQYPYDYPVVVNGRWCMNYTNRLATMIGTDGGSYSEPFISSYGNPLLSILGLNANPVFDGTAYWVSVNDSTLGVAVVRLDQDTLSPTAWTESISTTGNVSHLLAAWPPIPTYTISPPGVGSSAGIGTPSIVPADTVFSDVSVGDQSGTVSQVVDIHLDDASTIRYISIPQFAALSFATEFRLEQVTLSGKNRRISAFAPISSSEGHEDLVGRPFALGGLTQYGYEIVYQQVEKFKASIEVDADTCNVYKPVLLKYLPDEFTIKDYNDDLSEYLQVVAISMDEFYCFIQDFTKIFDPDRCPAKYLPYLAKLINWPLNTRGFDSPNASVRDAAVARARKQVRQAVEIYKRKGLKEAFQIMFYALGYYVELVELWTNNYINFVPQVPANERMYDPITNPKGWFKSPYFGLKIQSLNQSIEISTGGEGQPWNFDADSLQEIMDAIHSIRPVHTVLYWINYYFDLVEKFEFTDLDMDGGIFWEPTDEFYNCYPGDPVYYRDDRHLDGITRNGPDAISVDLKRSQQPGICDPDIDLQTELSDINWDVDPWCQPLTRDCGLLYRDGYNMNPRNGSVPNRDPSCFGGRNGFYWRDTPLAPFDSSAVNGLVWDRKGCYTVNESSFVPVYQLAEDVEDGIEMFYSEHEFNMWLDSMAAGFGPDPSLSGDSGGLSVVVNAFGTADPRSVSGNVMIDTGTDILSLFGRDGATYSRSITRLNFSSGEIAGVSVLTPATSLTTGYSGGAAGLWGGVVHYILGLTTGGYLNSDYLTYDINTNTLVKQDTLSILRKGAAYAQSGNRLFIFTGKDETDVLKSEFYILDMTDRSVEGPFTMPFSAANASACVVNQYIYIFGGEGNETGLWRFNTSTHTFEELPAAILGTSRPAAFKRNNLLYIVTGGTWTGGSFDASTYLQYDLLLSNWGAKGLIYNVAPTPLTAVIGKAGRFYGCGNVFDTTASSVIQVINFS